MLLSNTLNTPLKRWTALECQLNLLGIQIIIIAVTTHLVSSDCCLRWSTVNSWLAPKQHRISVGERLPLLRRGNINKRDGSKFPVIIYDIRVFHNFFLQQQSKFLGQGVLASVICLGLFICLFLWGLAAAANTHKYISLPCDYVRGQRSHCIEITQLT